VLHQQQYSVGLLKVVHRHQLVVYQLIKVEV
jgi:hypothetical protein